MEELLSRVEAGKLLGLSVWTIRRYERLGKLHPVRLSSVAVRIKRSELQALIEAAAQRPAEVPASFRKAAEAQPAQQ